MADLICTERDKGSADQKPRGRGLENCSGFDFGALSPDSPAGWRGTPPNGNTSAIPIYDPEMLSGLLQRAGEGTRDSITGPPKGLPVSKWPLKEKFAEVLRRTGPKLPGEMKNQFMALLTPLNLSIMAGTLAAWAVSQFFGVGEIIDLLLLIVGAFFLGMAIFTVAKDLWLFAKGTVDAQNEPDLDRAADKLAEAISIIGVAAFIALLAKLGGKLRAPKEEVPPDGPAPKKLPAKKPKIGEPGAAEWRYRRYFEAKTAKGEEPLPFDQWKQRYYDPAESGGRPGRPGGEAHRNDVQETLDANPDADPSFAIGDRVPDAVGAPGEPMQVRGQTITPQGNGRVIVESDKTVYDGTIPDSAARAQVRDMRAAAPDSTLVVTDYNNPTAAPLVYPPGSQPPPPGNLGPNPPTTVPYP